MSGDHRIGRRAAIIALAVACVAMIVAGLAGLLSAAWGYAFFAAAAILLIGAAAFLATLVLSRWGDTRVLGRLLAGSFMLGLASYALALSAFAGFFTFETLQGRMEMRWILFGPLALAALVVLDKGLYQKLVRNNLATWRRYRGFISRDRIEPDAARRTLVEDVLVHRSLFAVSRFRWLRHTLIYWGFVAMVGLELFAVLLREAFPAFGWRDVWHEPGNAIRLAFDVAFDLTGLMVLVGCLLALAWRIRVRGRPERKFSDTPSTLFLIAVVASGFVVEGLRLALAPGTPGAAWSFVGFAAARTLQALNAVRPSAYEPLWLAHTIAACAFIAYVPVMRLVHTCATPMGRLMNSQKALLAARRRTILGGLLTGRPASTPSGSGAAPSAR